MTEKEKKIERTLLYGLAVDGAHHKQQALEEALKILTEGEEVTRSRFEWLKAENQINGWDSKDEIR
jgi:hypothetical protein